MATSLRVGLFDEVRSLDRPFRTPFERFGGLEIVGECSSWQDLQVLLTASRLDAAIINLDGPDRKTGENIIRRITELAPQCGIIGVSQNADPDAIIAAMRAGCQQFVRWPVDADDLKAALDRVCRSRVSVSGKCRTIGVIGSSGGAGATTIACNLAMELAHATEMECALIDMDLQYGDVACAFDVLPLHSIADVCVSGTEVDRTLLETAMLKLPSNVSILARPEDLESAEEISAEVVGEMFRVLGQLFPFVVVDLPRYFSPTVHAAMDAVDRLLIVSQLTVPHLRHATRIYEALLQWGASDEQVDILLNRYNPHFDRLRPDEVEEHFRRPPIGIIPNDYKRIGASRDIGHPIMADSPNSPARLAIQEVARRLAGEHVGEEQLRSDKGGVFGMFRRRRSTTPSS
jgi:pilus assembly protein CpaE